MRTRFVAEVSSNHARSLDRSFAFVDTAAAIGCTAVKFQQFRITELFSPEALRANPKLRERIAWELPEEFNRELAARAHDRGIEFSSTPFYRDAVALLEPLVDFYKVASYQLLWDELLEEVGRTEKPVVLATGMATLEETERAVEVLRRSGCHDLTLLHCVSLYPTRAREANLRAIETLRGRFGGSVGWSDHSVDPQVVRRAVRRFGATMVEFHLDLEGAGEEYAAGHCWLPEEMQGVIEGLEAGAPEPPDALCDGDGVKRPAPGEAYERRWRTDPSDGLRPLLEMRRALESEEQAA